MRRRVGALLIVTGSALLVYVGAAWTTGAMARDRARAEWDARLARETVSAIAASLNTPATMPSGFGAPVARLRIPRLGLDEIVVEGVGDRELNAGPGHLPGSVFPGERGNSVISAHRDRHFAGLDRVAAGDTVITETLNGRQRWVVTRVQVLHRRAPALFETMEPTLTLTTCWPVRYFGPAPDRLLLTARLLDSESRQPKLS